MPVYHSVNGDALRLFNLFERNSTKQYLILATIEPNFMQALQIFRPSCDRYWTKCGVIIDTHSCSVKDWYSATMVIAKAYQNTELQVINRAA